MGNYPTLARNKRIYDLRLTGRTYDSLAEEFGLSRERVRAIVVKVDRSIARMSKRYFESVTELEVYGVWHTFTHEGRQKSKFVP
jgi:hypothetical protein